MCSSCKQVLPLNETYFGHNPQGGFRRKCRQCKRIYDKKYDAFNLDARYERNKTRAIRESMAVGNGISDSEKRKIRNLLEDTCAYCRVKLDGAGHFDHKMPIAKMGKNEASNMTLACEKCNLEKHAKDVPQYQEWRRIRNLSTQFHPSVFSSSDLLKVDFSNATDKGKVMHNQVIALARRQILIQKTVAHFAGELKLPTILLLEQLKSAGVHKSSAEDQLSEADKAALLEHLRKEHGTLAPKRKIILLRNSENSNAIISNERSKADRINATKVSQSLKENDELRDRYFSMSKEQLSNLWNFGDNEFEGDEADIVRIALKNKLQD